MTNLLTRLAKLETAEPVPVRFVMVGSLAAGELPAPGQFTFKLDRPRAVREGEADAPPKN